MTDCAKRRKVFIERGCVLGLGAAQKKYYKREPENGGRGGCCSRRHSRMHAYPPSVFLSFFLSVAIVPDCRVEFRVGSENRDECRPNPYFRSVRRQRTFDFQRNRRRKEKRRTRGWTTTTTMPFTYSPPPPTPPTSPPHPAVSGWVNSASGSVLDPRLGCVTRDNT